MKIDPDALRRAREAAGLNPSELSRRAGFVRNYVHRLENGTRGTNVSAQALTGLSEALEVEPETLLMDDDDPKVPSVTPTGPDAGSATSAAEPEPHPEAWRWG